MEIAEIHESTMRNKVYNSDRNSPRESRFSNRARAEPLSVKGYRARVRAWEGQWPRAGDRLLNEKSES
jgi:hypothetical protein